MKNCWEWHVAVTWNSTCDFNAHFGTIVYAHRTGDWAHFDKSDPLMIECTRFWIGKFLSCSYSYLVEVQNVTFSWDSIHRSIALWVWGRVAYVRWSNWVSCIRTSACNPCSCGKIKKLPEDSGLVTTSWSNPRRLRERSNLSSETGTLSILKAVFFPIAVLVYPVYFTPKATLTLRETDAPQPWSCRSQRE